ncbi:SgcJ/EcaC family oxidoreductase [Nonomuraea sp. NBC_00507]|uniref:SgcJ/EcaC family oxidoreductase n=1 Tax=Nonomuraea sp. NBC_00507 TaxID=2976002 RepID=UPI002E18459F
MMNLRVSACAAFAAGAVLLVTATGGGQATAQTHAAPAAARPAQPAAAAKPSKAQIAALFITWNAALTSGDPRKVADLYAPGAVLLPTASPKIRTNRAQIVDYFEHFLQKKPTGKKIRTIVKVLDANTAIDTGLYRFTLTGKDGKKQSVDARYTYLYEKRGGQWLIVNHHSSVLPPEG